MFSVWIAVLYAHFGIDRSTQFYFVYIEIQKTTHTLIVYVSTRRCFGLFINYVHNLFRFYRLLYIRLSICYSWRCCMYLLIWTVLVCQRYITIYNKGKIPYGAESFSSLSLENGGELIYGVPYRQRPYVVITATPSSIQLTSYTNKYIFMRRVLLIWQAKQFLCDVQSL